LLAVSKTKAAIAALLLALALEPSDVGAGSFVRSFELSGAIHEVGFNIGSDAGAWPVAGECFDTNGATSACAIGGNYDTDIPIITFGLTDIITIIKVECYSMTPASKWNSGDRVITAFYTDDGTSFTQLGPTMIFDDQSPLGYKREYSIHATTTTPGGIIAWRPNSVTNTKLSTNGFKFACTIVYSRD